MKIAQTRREQELRQLAAEGVPLSTLGKSGHWVIGSLHLYTASGRWFHEGTGRRGRLNGNRMRAVIEREFGSIATSWYEVGRSLCPEAALRSEAARLAYEQYQRELNEARRKTRKYEIFMARARREASRLAPSEAKAPAPPSS